MRMELFKISKRGWWHYLIQLVRSLIVFETAAMSRDTTLYFSDLLIWSNNLSFSSFKLLISFWRSTIWIFFLSLLRWALCLSFSFFSIVLSDFLIPLFFDDVLEAIQMMVSWVQKGRADGKRHKKSNHTNMWVY